jgi:hypothetical protein
VFDPPMDNAPPEGKSSLAAAEATVEALRAESERLAVQLAAAQVREHTMREALKVATSPQACDGSGASDRPVFDEVGNAIGMEHIQCYGCCACLTPLVMAALGHQFDDGGDGNCTECGEGIANPVHLSAPQDDAALRGLMMKAAIAGRVDPFTPSGAIVDRILGRKP